MGFSQGDLARKFSIREALPSFSYSLADFEIDLWVNRGHIDENIRMAGADKEIYPVIAAARHDALQWIFEGLANGFTAIFNKLNLCNPQVARLSQEISGSYPDGARAFVTAFLSPSSLHCFGYHYDEVDVFLVQIHGTKAWSVARPQVAYPIEGMDKPPVDQDQSGNEYLRDTLEPGDVLYIPRGHIHRGLPGEAGSLHLSVGVHVPTVADRIASVVRQASKVQEVLRRPVDSTATDSLVREALQQLGDTPAPKQEEAESRTFLPGESLLSTLRIGKLRANDVLSKVDGIPVRYRLARDLTTIEVFGLLFDYGVRAEARARAALPAGYFRALQLINASDTFTPEDLAKTTGLSVTDVLEVGRRLLTIGVLEFKSC